MERWVKNQIIKDLDKKMVFIVGPRQVGKTWLAQNIAKTFNNTVYLNYDSISDREIIKNEMWLDNTELLIFDEIHKMPEWKNYLKGVYDTKSENLKILITGSARLDTFRQSGDSLSGRFYAHRLLPFSLKELKQHQEDVNIHKLISRSGFPEPYLSDNDIDASRWRNHYIDGLIRTDILDFERVHNLRAIMLIFELLQERVGSPISYQSISEDIGVSPNTVRKYIQIFEALYIIFRVTPYSKNIARSLKKEPKIYFFDNGMVKGGDGARFENFIAVGLLKHVYGREDIYGIRSSLHYLRTKEKREVDFCITEDGNAKKIIEAKLSDRNLSRELLYFSSRYQIPAIQTVLHLKQERKFDNIEIIKAEKFLSKLDF